jgi:hypothetical protein
LVSPGSKFSLHIAYERGGEGHLWFWQNCCWWIISLGMWIVSNIPRIVLPGYEGGMIVQNVEDYLCNDTVSHPRKLEFLDWLVLDVVAKRKKYPPPPGTELDWLIPHHHTNCELFYSYVICDWGSVHHH